MSRIITCPLLLLFGLLVLCDGQIGIQATPTSEVRWLTVFAELDNWIGWLFIWMGVDSLFGGGLMRLLSDKVISHVITPVVKSIVGEERLVRLRTKLKT